MAVREIRRGVRYGVFIFLGSQQTQGLDYEGQVLGMGGEHTCGEEGGIQAAPLWTLRARVCLSGGWKGFPCRLSAYWIGNTLALWRRPSPNPRKRGKACGRDAGRWSRGRPEAWRPSAGQAQALGHSQSVRIRSAPPTKRDWMQITWGSCP